MRKPESIRIGLVEMGRGDGDECSRKEAMGADVSFT